MKIFIWPRIRLTVKHRTVSNKFSDFIPVRAPLEPRQNTSRQAERKPSGRKRSAAGGIRPGGRAVFTARQKRSCGGTVQGVQPFVQNIVTQNSPDTRVSGLFVPHAEPRQGVSAVCRRVAAVLRPEMDP